MDAEQRARLVALAEDVRPEVRGGQVILRRDLVALLAAYDAAVAERDRYRKRLDELTDDRLLEGLSDTDLERYGQSSPQELYRWLLAAEQERDQQTALVRQWDERDHEKTVQIARLEQERDQARASLEEHRIAYSAVAGERDAAEARATRLAALEQAARVLVYGGDPVLLGVQRLHGALTAVAAPPGETRSADAP